MHTPQVISSPGTQQLLNWLTRPYAFLDECTQRYGDTFTLNLAGSPPIILTGDPQIIKEIFATDAKHFDAGRGQGILGPLVGDHSLLLLDGKQHRRDRKLLMPPFHGARVKAYGEEMCQITQEVANRWQSGQSFLASEAMADITLEVILKTVFGLREGDRYQRIKSLLISLLALTDSPLSATLLFFPWLQKDLGPWSPWGKFVRQRAEVYGLLQAEIELRRSQLTSQPTVEGDDVLGVMLSARDEQGQPMTDGEVKDELMTMLFAGHETTATVLTWALYWIHRLPDVKAKLLAELESVKGSGCMQIAALPYLSAVASEALRMYPIAPIISPRIANEPVTIQGQRLEKNTIIAPCMYTLHHRADLYPDSKAFKPERFLNHQFAPSEFIPFGGGNRRCLGYAFAKLELNLVLATVLQNYSLRLANDQPVVPRRRGALIATSNGVPLVLDT